MRAPADSDFGRYLRRPAAFREHFPEPAAAGGARTLGEETVAVGVHDWTVEFAGLDQERAEVLRRELPAGGGTGEEAPA